MILEEVDDDDDNKGVVSIVFSPYGESPNMVNAQILCKTKRERDLKVSTFLVALACACVRMICFARVLLWRNSSFLFFLKGCYEVKSVKTLNL